MERSQQTTQKYRNTKDHKRLSAIICQKNGQCGRNGQILRKVQLSKTEPGINRKP